MTRARDRSPALALIARARMRHFKPGGPDQLADEFADHCISGQLLNMALWWADEQASYTEWPWDEVEEDLPERTPRSQDPAGVADLVTAAALLAAEIDRRLRAAGSV